MPLRPRARTRLDRGQRLDVVHDAWGWTSGTASDHAGAAPRSTRPSGTVANRPWMYGGSVRGSGASPSMTWSSAGLLAEQVGVGPEHDLDRDVADAGPRPSSRRPLRASALDLRAEALLDADERPLGPHGEGGDRDALDDRVGVGADDRPVLEGRRVPPRRRCKRRTRFAYRRRSRRRPAPTATCARSGTHRRPAPAGPRGCTSWIVPPGPRACARRNPGPPPRATVLGDMGHRCGRQKRG